MKLEDQEEMQEIGEEGYKHFKKALKFGDVIENGWASMRNPIRFGIVLKVKQRTIACTDGTRFWDLCFDYQTKLKIHGNAFKPIQEFKGSELSEPATGIILGCISPEARDLLDTIMEHWEKYYADYKQLKNNTEPTFYGFAYWLVRWSGLIQPTNVEK